VASHLHVCNLSNAAGWLLLQNWLPSGCESLLAHRGLGRQAAAASAAAAALDQALLLPLLLLLNLYLWSSCWQQ
jgi:hypothetical protein